MITIKTKLNLTRTTKGKRQIRLATEAAPPPPLRVPRISRLVALALKLDRQVREGAFTDYSEVARLACVSQPRMTQLCNMTLLAPDILEDLLHLSPAPKGRDPIHEKLLRPVTALSDWNEQRRLWSRLQQRLASDGGPAA